MVTGAISYCGVGLQSRERGVILVVAATPTLHAIVGVVCIKKVIMKLIEGFCLS